MGPRGGRERSRSPRQVQWDTVEEQVADAIVNRVLDWREKELTPLQWALAAVLSLTPGAREALIEEAGPPLSGVELEAVTLLPKGLHRAQNIHLAVYLLENRSKREGLFVATLLRCRANWDKFVGQNPAKIFRNHQQAEEQKETADGQTASYSPSSSSGREL